MRHHAPNRYNARAVPRFFAPEAAAGSSEVTLAADDAHHLLHVLRLGVGADVAIFDGRGHEWAARVVRAGKRVDVAVELLHARAPAREPPVDVMLGVGVVKGDQMDQIVRDAVMLGVASIAPVVSDHVSVPARAWRNDAARSRWERVAVASTRQCGRAVVPVIEPVVSFQALLDRTSDRLRIMCVEPALAVLDTVALNTISRPESALALVGPEGGWSAGEMTAARERGVTPVALGPRTLRAESAPVVLLSALWTVWGW